MSRLLSATMTSCRENVCGFFRRRQPHLQFHRLAWRRIVRKVYCIFVVASAGISDASRRSLKWPATFVGVRHHLLLQVRVSLFPLGYFWRSFSYLLRRSGSYDPCGSHPIWSAIAAAAVETSLKGLCCLDISIWQTALWVAKAIEISAREFPLHQFRLRSPSLRHM